MRSADAALDAVERRRVEPDAHRSEIVQDLADALLALNAHALQSLAQFCTVHVNIISQNVHFGDRICAQLQPRYDLNAVFTSGGDRSFDPVDIVMVGHGYRSEPVLFRLDYDRLGRIRPVRTRTVDMEVSFHRRPPQARLSPPPLRLRARRSHTCPTCP